MKTTLCLIALGALMSGCSSESHEGVRKDVHGNYATIAQFNAMERDDFTAAMQAGMREFDQRLVSLQAQAEALGPDAMEEYADDLEDLTAQRRAFEAEVEKHDAMLGGEWRDHREDVAEQSIELRESLDDAFEDVVDES